MSPSQQHDKTLLQLNFFIIFSSLSFLGIALWLIAQRAIFLFLNKFHFRHSSIIPGLMSLDAICINGWLGFLHSFSCSLSRRFPLITKRIIWEENTAKQKRRREGKTLCFWYRVNIRRLLRCSLVLHFEWPGESCNAICVLLLLQKAPQLHPSNMKLMTISQHEHEIFMFSFTLFSSPPLASFFSQNPLPRLSLLLIYYVHRSIWCERTTAKKPFQESVGRLDVIVNYVCFVAKGS